MRTFASAVAAIFTLVGAAFAQTPPGAEVYGALPAASAAALSPNGQRLILAIASGDATGVRAIEVDGGRELMAARTPTGNTLWGVDWADDDHPLFRMSQSVRPREFFPHGAFRGNPAFIEYVRIGLISIPARREYYVEPISDAGTLPPQFWRFLAPIEGDPGYGRVLGWSFANGEDTVYRVSLETGRAGPTIRGVADTLDFIFDERGDVVARVDADTRSNRWRLMRRQTWTESADDSDGVRERAQYSEVLGGVSEIGAPPNIAGLLPDGRVGVADDMETRDLAALMAVDLTSGATTILHEDARYPIEDAILDPWTHRIVGAAWTADFPQQIFFDAALQETARQASQAFADGYAEIVSWSRDRKRFLVFGERATDAGGYYIYEPQTRALRMVAMRYPALNGLAQLGERQAINFRARDGVRIPAYLTAPAGVEKRNLPLVLLVHGGPVSRDTFSFDWMASFLASRGYAVLQVNFRGSGGYGRTWRNAGFKQWGGLMQTDVEDGAAALIRAGIVDARRICIVGASYGGYSALAGATLTPERYACAASVAGVSDLEVMLSQMAARNGVRSIASDWWRMSIGDRAEDRAAIRAVSPVHLVANVRAPILLMHGSQDTVVPIDQSRRMEAALRRAGKNVRFVELQGDDHWLTTAATRIQMLRELETFLAQHLRSP